MARYGFQALAIDAVYAGVTVANGLWRLQAPSREGNAGTVGAEHGREEVVGDFRECRSRRDLARQKPARQPAAHLMHKRS